jgi:TonB family protein
MFVGLFVLALAVPQSTAQQQPPRDRPGLAAPSMAPTGVAGAIQLAKQQEDRGDYAEAEATLMKARAASPSSKDAILALAAFYNRQGSFDKTIASLEEAAQLTPDDPQGYQIIATYYWEKAFKDHRLLPAEQYTYILQGIAATDRALALKPDYAEALTYKNLLLRLRANLETDPVLKQQLVADADELRNRAIELNKTRTAIGSSDRGVMLGPVPPPPPPPPPAAGDYPYPTAPVRVGGNIKVPTKIKDVRPIYPPDAQAAGIQGVVIIEAVIDPAGTVGSARVLRSIPMLDQAAVDAVKQWEFTPTLLNGVAVPVIMTVTVNFTTQ